MAPGRCFALLLVAALTVSACGTSLVAVPAGSEQTARYRAVRKVPLTVGLLLPPEFQDYTQTVKYGPRSAEVHLGPAMVENARRALPQAFEGVVGVSGGETAQGEVQATVRPEILDVRVATGGGVKASCEVRARWTVKDAGGKVLWEQVVTGSAQRDDIQAVPLSVAATLAPCMEAAVQNHYLALLRDVVVGEWWVSR